MSTSRKSRFGRRPYLSDSSSSDAVVADLSSSTGEMNSLNGVPQLELELAMRMEQQGAILEAVEKKIDELRMGQQRDSQKLLDSSIKITEALRSASTASVDKQRKHAQPDAGTVLVAVRGSLDVLAKEFSRVASDLGSVKAQAQSDQHAVELAEARQDLAVARHELAELTRRLFAVQDDNQWLELELQEKYKELSTLTLMLQSAPTVEFSPEVLSEVAPESKQNLESEMVPPATGWSLGRVLRRNLSPDIKLKKISGKLKIHAKLIADSGLFDAKWYSDKYLTNVEERSAPIEHYLIVGAKEGFDPGASFCTRWYLDRYPDVAASSMNPLVHYIQHGMAEGREPLPH